MVEINRKFQDLHGPGSSIDWVALQRVERDICLLYHQLADYSYIMGDLYYGSVYELPYWQYLDVREADQIDRDFLRDGCLVMILAMAWDVIDGSGSHLVSQLSECQRAVGCLEPADERTSKLVRAVQQALQDAECGVESEDLRAVSSWVHEEYVKGYFRTVAHGFDFNPYHRGALPGEDT